MNNLMVFNDMNVEVFELDGTILFNPYHCGECLELGESAVRMAICNMSNKQVVKLTNSNVKDIDFRRLHNTGENFLTESGVYKLIFKSNKPNAEKFQDWVTDEVLPSIRKNGNYQIKGKVLALPKSIENIAEDAKRYYRLPHSEKLNFNRRIKNGLGDNSTEKEIADVKDYVFTILGIEKWEDLPLGQAMQVVDLIDRRCRIIVEERISLFNWNK